MSDPHDDTAQEPAGAEANDVIALEAGTAAISAQLAATEHKVTDVLALLNGLRLKLELFTEIRMGDIRKYLAYRDCTTTVQVSDGYEVMKWQDHTDNWNPTTRRQFQDAWSAAVLASSARACEHASRIVRRAMDNLSQFKNMSMPFDDGLTDRARHEILLMRQIKIRHGMQAVLRKELYEAKTLLSKHLGLQITIDKKKGEKPSVTAYNTANTRRRQELVEEQWNATFASVPNTTAARRGLINIWAFLELPFVHELPKLAKELDTVIAALKDEVLEAILE